MMRMLCRAYAVAMQCFQYLSHTFMSLSSGGTPLLTMCTIMMCRQHQTSLQHVSFWVRPAAQLGLLLQPA